MNNLERQLMSSEADLFRMLSEHSNTALSNAAQFLSFGSSIPEHNYRMALHQTLLANARYLETMANLLKTLTEAHGLPNIC